MAKQEEIEELHFELASESRLGILGELEKKPVKMRELVSRLRLTDTEAFRQLRRLSEAQLVEKLPDGTYRLTPYAKLVKDNCSPLEFISKHRGYFLEHDAFLLPREFRSRLDELSGCEYIPTTVGSFNKGTEYFSGAKRIDAVIFGTEAMIERLRVRIEEGVKMRWLMHESFLDRAPAVLRKWKTLPEIRVTPEVPGHILVTDRAALITIRRHNGEVSYDSFVGEDPSFLKWAGDLFAHEWQKARPWQPWD